MKIYINTTKGGKIKRGWYLYVLEYSKEDGKTVSKSNLDRMTPVENTTAARLTLMALTEAVNRIKVDNFVDVEIDVGNTIVYQALVNHWYERWARKEFEDIKNADLWKEYREAVNAHPRCAFTLIEPNSHNEYSSWLEFNIKQKEGKGKCR